MKLNRREDWRNQIIYAFSQADEQEWQGNEQRYAFAFFVIERLTTEDLLQKILENTGKSLEELKDKHVFKFLTKNLEKINPLKAKQGDLVFSEEYGLGICAGFLNAFANKDGIVYQDRKQARHAWRV